MHVPQRHPLHVAPLAIAVGVTIYLSNWSEIPRWVKYYPRDWKIPAEDKLNELFTFLAEEASLGLFTFKELTRGLAWGLERFLLFVQGCLEAVSSSTPIPTFLIW